MRAWKKRGAGGPLLAVLCIGVLTALLTAVPAGAAVSTGTGGSGGSNSSTSDPPSVLPVIVLQGSDYDMGYQYFQQIDALFGSSILEAIQVPSGFTAEQLTALKAYQWYIERYTPEYIEMFKGMAAAATDLGVPLSNTEVLANYVGTRAYPGTEPAGSKKLSPLCSAWAAWGRTTTNHKLIQAQEMDPPWGSFGDNTYVAIVAYPATGNAYINVTQPGDLTSIPVMPGINNKGVATGGNLGGAWRDADWGAGGYGLKTGLIMHILRFADSAAAAKDMWVSFHSSGVWNMMTSDTKGRAFVVESSAAFQNVRKPGQFGEGSFIYSRNCFFTNRAASLNGLPGKFYPHGGFALNPQMKAPPDSQSDMQLASVRTNQTMYNMLHQYTGRVSLAFAQMMFRYHGKIPRDPWDLTAFRRNKAKYFGNPGNLNAGFVTISRPTIGSGGTMYICTGAVGRVGLPYEAGPHDDVYFTEGTHTFYSLVLDGSAEATAGASQSVAQRAVGRAYQKLMHKKYSDPGYDTLIGLFRRANSEYLEGSSWLNKAARDTGSQQLLDFSQAATCFANAQAHAEELREEIVRPAVTPSDLGLKRYIPYAYGF